MDRTKKESLLERYWRLRGEADELYQRRMREIGQRISVEMRQSVQRELDALEDAIENIDIGGPTMLRSSAKNLRASRSSWRLLQAIRNGCRFYGRATHEEDSEL